MDSKRRIRGNSSVTNGLYYINLLEITLNTDYILVYMYLI